MTGTRSGGPAGAGQRTGPRGPDTESVPGYRELKRIGHGGFSVVYRAVQESVDRAVALKVLTVGPGEDARGRFLREIRLAGRLSGHPHVVTVLDTGTTESGRPYLAMDLYDGGSMKQRLVRSGPLCAAETAVVGAKVAEALAAAHALGVLHRDVKPNNILISRFGEPALADFGVSCLLDSSASASVLDVFSPQHAAPELMTRGVPSASADVYALGSTLFELVTGQPPFGAQDRDMRSVIWRTLSEPAPRPDCADLPELADAIVRAMAKDPQDRFTDAAEFARTLRAMIPDGAPATLVMPAEPDSSHPAPGSGAEAGGGDRDADWDADADWDGDQDEATGAGAGRARAAGLEDFGEEADSTSYRRSPAADETRLRPDRAAIAGAGGAAGEGAEDRGTAGRLRKPLAVASAVVLLGAVGWAVFASQGSSPGTTDDASAHRSPAAPTAGASRTPSRTRPAPSTAPAKHLTSSGSPAAAKPPISAPAGGTGAASPTSSSGSLLSLIDTYYRFRNEQSGDCLAQPGGSSPSTQACTASGTESWQFSVPIGGLLSAPTSGEFELVNKADGECLTAGSGTAVSMQTCDGGSAQLWEKAGTGASGTELRDTGDAQCLRAMGSAAVQGPCETGDAADLWSQDGTG